MIIDYKKRQSTLIKIYSRSHISSMIKQEPSQSAAEEASSDLFNPKSKIFVNSVTASCVMLLIFSIAGIAFQVCYLNPRTRMIEAAKSKLLYYFQFCKYSNFNTKTKK